MNPDLSTVTSSSLKRVRLELAREPQHPAGSRDHGYELVLPVDAEGRLDPDLWRRERGACRVVRFRPGEADEVGHLVHRGAKGWLFRYDVAGRESDERGFRFAAETFRIGEYVSVDEEHGEHTYKVTRVERY